MAKKKPQNPYADIRKDILEELREIHLDRADAGYAKEIKRDMEHLFQLSAKHVKNNENLTIEYSVRNNHSCRKRRIAAAVEFAPKVAERYEKQFPRLDIDHVFTRICCEPYGNSINFTDKYEYTMLACALYMLDELKAAGNIIDALHFIPSKPELLSEIELPYSFCDSQHENDVIRGLMYLLYHRNDGENTEKGEEKCVFINSYTAKATSDTVEPIGYKNGLNKLYDKYAELDAELWQNAQAMNNRQRLNAIYSYMRPAAIELAVKRFEDDLWQLLDFIFAGVDKFDTERITNLEAALKTVEKAEKAKERFSAVFESEDFDRFSNNLFSYIKQPALLINKKATGSVFKASFSDNLPDVDPRYTLENYNTLASAVNKYGDELGELEDEIRKAETDTAKFITYVMGYGRILLPEMGELYDDALLKMRVVNPFETCFAYLWLIDRGDNIPWLTGISDCVVCCASRMLPWSNLYNAKIQQIANERKAEDVNALNVAEKIQNIMTGGNMSLNKAAEVVDEILSTVRHGVTETGDVKEVDEVCETTDIDVYHTKKYLSPVEFIDDTELCTRYFERRFNDYADWTDENLDGVTDSDYLSWNFGQFIYSGTGMVVPRNIYRTPKYKENLTKSGFEEGHEDIALAYLSVCENASNKTAFIYPPVNIQADTESISDLKATISEQANRISGLKTALHAAQKDAERVQKNADKRDEDCELDRQELAELRELIYRLQNNEVIEETKEETAVNLPYRTERNIVVFGGHESWLTNIKQYLPNVRIIRPDTNPDTNTIRNADEVWLQSNAMPHSYYYKIMDIVRLRKIPLKYFAYASAEKCARQFVVHDMLISKNKERS